MDKTQQIKAELENYRANKILGAGNTQGNIKSDLENYRASKIVSGETTEVETPSFGTSLARGILKTPARLATNLVQAEQIATGQPTTEPFSGKLLGEVKPIPGPLTEEKPFEGLKQAVGAGIELASYIPVTRGVSSVAKATLGQKALKGGTTALKEGFTGGFMSESGRALTEGDTVGEAFVRGIGGGLVAAPVAGVIGTTAPLVSKALGIKPKINVQEVKDEVIKNTSKALGVFGKKPVKMAQGQPQKMAEGLAVLRKYGDFDPKVSEDIFDDSIKGLIKAKETVFKTYDDIARQSGDQGLLIDINKLAKPLEKYIKQITTEPKRNRAIRILKELKSNFPDGKATPVQIQEYIKLLNEELGGLAGGAEKGAVGVVSDFVRNTTDTLDNEISKLGSQYKSFRKEYAGLKSIEDALVKQYQKAMRQKGSGLTEYSDMFANAEMINGLITANPGLVAKSLTMRGISGLIKRANNPETYLRKAFEGLDQIGDEMLPKTTRGIPQLRLPAPKPGTPQSQVNVPINQPTRKMIQQGTEIVPRGLPKTQQNIGSNASVLNDIKNNIKTYKNIFTDPKTYAGKTNLTVKEKQTILSHMVKDASDAIKREGMNVPDELTKLKIEANDTPFTLGDKILKIVTGKKAVPLLDKIKSIPNKQGGMIKAYGGEKDLTTKILKDLEGKTTVSKQYILDATNRGELKQVERDLIRDLVKNEPDIVNVSDFAKKVKAELLPLKRSDTFFGSKRNKYENISLPDELRGNVKDYSENIYESPIKTSAGNTHFGKDTENYFGHTRIEDMADNKTRRVIEVQSDLYQKGNLAREAVDAETRRVAERAGFSSDPEYLRQFPDMTAKIDVRQKELSKLKQYNDPTAHFRMIREEIKKAAQDGKTKLQFPTGETAMKIEGLGDNNNWSTYRNGIEEGVEPNQLKVGMDIFQHGPNSDNWIITEVLGDGKFKAVPKNAFEREGYYETLKPEQYRGLLEQLPPLVRNQETFDISGKVDTNNPIYKFYEKDVAKYLNKFGGKRVVDDKGVSWIEIPITKEQGKAPVEAFGKVGVSPLFIGAAGSAGAVFLNRLLKDKENK